MKKLVQTFSLILAVLAIGWAAYVATQDPDSNEAANPLFQQAPQSFRYLDSDLLIAAAKTPPKPTLKATSRRNPHKVYRDLQRRNLLKGIGRRMTALA